MTEYDNYDPMSIKPKTRQWVHLKQKANGGEAPVCWYGGCHTVVELKPDGSRPYYCHVHADWKRAYSNRRYHEKLEAKKAMVSGLKPC